MVSSFRQNILDGLQKTRKATARELIGSGMDAARKTVELMQATFAAIPPADIVQVFVEFGKGKQGRAAFMWDRFGDATIKAMQNGAHLLAVLWEGAWVAGAGETTMASPRAVRQDEAMGICAARDFLLSLSIDQIGARLSR